MTPTDPQSLRDPRIDPKPGDAIARNNPNALQGMILRDVTRAHGGFVFFGQDNGYISKPRITSLVEWRAWAKKAEVCDVAE
jgi:hypothetical protein